jgi:hypothetical protein
VRATKDHAAIRPRFEKRLLDGIVTRSRKSTECSKEVVGNCPELERWLFSHLNSDTYPYCLVIALGVLVAACLGPFWMLHDWFIKNQKRNLKRRMWFIFVPWGFLLYCFEVHRESTCYTSMRHPVLERKARAVGRVCLQRASH